VISKANEWGENDHWWMLSTINQSFLRFRLKTQGQTTDDPDRQPGRTQLGEWQHAAATWDGARDAALPQRREVASAAKAGTAVATDSAVRAAISSQPKGAYATDPLHANKFFDGRIDEVRIYSSALSPAQLEELIQGLHPIAWKPNPEDGAQGVLQPLLRWTASDTGILHDVYLGTSPDLGPQQRVASRQAAAMYWHGPGFEPGATYYWRVDEIDAAGNVATGRVWSFVSASLTAYKPQPADGCQMDRAPGSQVQVAARHERPHARHLFRPQQAGCSRQDGRHPSRASNPASEPGVLKPALSTTGGVDENLDGSKRLGRSGASPRWPRVAASKASTTATWI
jgi:hypothetical protein